MEKIKVGIVGGTGYTGIELLRILINHPGVELAAITSRANDGTAVTDFFPSLRGKTDLKFTVPTLEQLRDCQLVFFATPSGIAMKMVPELVENGIRVIDLAADFRITDQHTWEHWYAMEHACPEYLAESVYGLPEVRREEIKNANLVANPGCYPTAVQLGLLPLVESGVIDTKNIITDAKSGVSGAGRNPMTKTLLGEASESFQAYAASGHRHWAEITQEINIASKSDVNITFVPHLVPMTRGIFVTQYCDLIDEVADLQKLFEDRYADEPFVDVMPFGSHPDTKTVRGSNLCRLALQKQEHSNKLIVLSVIDNLVKGASGQAVQNMNIMLELPEEQGLDIMPLMV
ncbi:MAG: N-acetyl-gamma-glutamyl-phosphate reductase [Gammaproteobacteria bacterium]|nr:MAG: N-acetyl-gamma-glutamyl-phosphate reductase [Gammaproteobacteria bacterium]